MATPVGHALLGAGVGIACTSDSRISWQWFFFLAVSGVAADLDFLPGLLVGDINRWHHLASHSFAAALVWGVLSAVLVRYLQPQWPYLAAGATAALAYASHLLLDWLTTDTRAPFGIPLFWPINDRAWLSPYTPIPGVSHGVDGDSFWVVVKAVFSLSNFFGALIEVIVVAPVVLVLWTGRRLLQASRRK